MSRTVTAMLLTLTLLMPSQSVFSQTSAAVELSAAELAWIKQHTLIRVANEDDWPPYDFTDRGVPSGYSIDLIKLVAEKVGLQLEFINGYSWDELLQMGRDGELDLFPAIWKTPERELFLDYTSAYAETPHILLIREEDNRIRSINDLNGRTLAGIKGYADVEMIKEHYPAIHLHEVTNISEGLRAVAYGHADAYLGTLGAVSHALRENQISGLKILGETTLEGRVKAGEMHFATRKELAPLAGIVQKGLDAVTREERMAIQNRWLFTLHSSDGVDENSLESPTSLTWGIAIAVALILLTLLMVILLPRLISDEALTRHIGSRRFRSSVVIVLTVMVALVLLLVEQTLQHHYQQMLSTTQNELEIVLETAAERIDDWEQEQKRYLLQLGRDAELVSLTRKLLERPADTEALALSDELAAVRQFFARRADEFGTTGFFLINADGISIGSRRDTNLGTPNLIAQRHPELFQLTLSGEAIFVPPIESDVHIDPSAEATTKRKPTTMFFAVPITDQDGTVLAVMTQRLRPEGQLSELMKYGRIGQSGESYAIDQYGQLVTSSRFREQLIEVGLIQRSEQIHGRLIVSDPGGNMLNGFQPRVEREQQPLTRMAQALLKDAANKRYTHQHQHIPAISSDMSGYRDYRGVPVFGAWVWNPHLGLGITTEIDVDEAMVGYHSLRRNLFIITGLTLIFSITAVVITLMLASRATGLLRRSHTELESLVDKRTAALTESEEKYRLLFELSQDPMWLIVEGHFVMANTAAARLLGYDNEESLINIPPSQLSPEEQPDGERSELKADSMMRTAHSVGYHRFEWMHKRKNDELFPVEVSLTRIKYEGKDALFCIWRDISEQKANEAGLKRATVEAQQANRAKSEFLSSMSHELRTPLNAILGFSQLLETEENLTAEQKDNIHDIIRAGSHLLDLINEVLDLAKIESGKLELSIEPVPLNDLMNACHKLVAPMAEQHGIRLKLDDGCLAGHTLSADFTRTKQILLNLLSNAIKYNRDHGSVTVSCQQLAEQLRIEVRDTGPGIPAHKLNKLFEAFNRLGAESGTIEGTGIGLVITRQLVETMGGELGVDSIEGEGSTFWFTLPWLEQQSSSPAVTARPQNRPTEAKHLSGQQKVLYIEDNPVNLKLVEKLIAKQTELVLVSAEEPVSGIEKAISEQPDLILLDINLPTMSGYEVVKKLREMEETQNIPVIALTANAMAEDIAKGEEAGFDDYLTKPIQIKSFLEMLQRYLGE